MSKYFTVNELTRSDKARQNGLKNIPSQVVTLKLQQLIERVLDPLRELWGAPLLITSGYRCTQLNRIVGGVANSQHIAGEAADLTAGSRAENRALYEMAVRSKIPYDQIILEKGGLWIHISYRRNQPRRQHLEL
ncbi:MAG: peptidase M15 [Rikenellaceae bacterium]|nr:peptidase M15 [Rikenellaceae bacterium]